ncbi:MAG: hypothetical protein LBS19_10525 [Clostridiales bacterium]|nr:hypothetical protein [Clostridiales bacterium]
MKKRLFTAILATCMLLTLVACGDNDRPAQETLTPSPSESSSESINNDEESSTNELSAKPSVPSKESVSDKIMDLPDDISRYEDGDIFHIGSFGYEPQTIKSYVTAGNVVTLSVPEIPESLKQFAKSRGDSYIMVHAENSQDGSVMGVLFFYQDNCTLTLQKGGGVRVAGGVFLQPFGDNLSTQDTYFPYGFNYSEMKNSEINMGFNAFCYFAEDKVYDDGESGTAIDYWDDLVEAMDKDYKYGEYTATSVYPTEEHIQKLLQAIETHGANQN